VTAPARVRQRRILALAIPAIERRMQSEIGNVQPQVLVPDIIWRVIHVGNPEVVSSLEVAQLAQARLQTSPYTVLRKVSCGFDQGVLTLHGRLPRYYHKQLAQEAVADLHGVLQVVNQIEVIL
jgi:hypothetical protein